MNGVCLQSKISLHRCREILFNYAFLSKKERINVIIPTTRALATAALFEPVIPEMNAEIINQSEKIKIPEAIPLDPLNIGKDIISMRIPTIKKFTRLPDEEVTIPGMNAEIINHTDKIKIIHPFHVILSTS